VSRRQTVAELLGQVKALEPYQEAFWALRRGEKPVLFTSGEGEEFRSVELLGASRACGGVVLLEGSVMYAERWAAEATHSVDPYLADLGRRVHRAIVEAVRARVYEGAMGRS
jgi:hypothetical protein